jgi:hypothetical protein
MTEDGLRRFLDGDSRGGSGPLFHSGLDRDPAGRGD